MPRKSLCAIVLSEEEQKELIRRASKHTLPYFKVARAKMILLAAQGLDNDEIATRLDTPVKLSACGANGSFENASQGLRSDLDRDAPWLFPPEIVIQIKALAGELPSTHHAPISRLSISDLGRQVRQSGLMATISDNTIWR